MNESLELRKSRRPIQISRSKKSLDKKLKTKGDHFLVSFYEKLMMQKVDDLANTLSVLLTWSFHFGRFYVRRVLN